MKNNKQIEQQLLEEQLRAVTGGCNACVTNKTQAVIHLHASAQAEARALTHPDVNVRNQLQNEANNELTSAMNLLAQIRQRQQNPNHRDMPTL